MSFWRCYYHVVWSTKNRASLISDEIERVILESIKAKSLELECPVLAANTCKDHVHVAVNIPPKVAVAEWVRNIKGRSARDVNGTFPDLSERFQWQDSYGVLTFGAKVVDEVVNYIEQQKEHHLRNTINPYLEKIDN